jgi:hypothetical protein
MLDHLGAPAIGLFANNDFVGEASGILLYVIVPLLVGGPSSFRQPPYK